MVNMSPICPIQLVAAARHLTCFDSKHLVKPFVTKPVLSLSIISGRATPAVITKIVDVGAGLGKRTAWKKPAARLAHLFIRDFL
jgi:hypothetical protein